MWAEGMVLGVRDNAIAKRTEPVLWGLPHGAVELVERRTRDAKHFLNPDGTFTAVFGRGFHYEAERGLWLDIFGLRPIAGGSPTTTFTVNVGADNGKVGKWHDGTYPPTANSEAVAPTTPVSTQRSKVGSTFDIHVALMRWDTSSLPDGATIQSATLRVYVGAGMRVNTDARNLTADWYTAWPIDIADYIVAAQTSAIAGVALSSITEGVDNDFVLADAPANVSKIGYTGLRLHISGGQPTGRNYLGTPGYPFGGDPFNRLIVTYTLPSNLALVSMGAKLIGEGLI